MTDFFRFAAFISYSSKDAVFAQRLHRALEAYAIPKALGQFDLLGGGDKPNRLYPVFRDREELSAGDLGARLQSALNVSATLIVVCSPDAAQSRWVQKEIEYFGSLGRKHRIFAIIADTAPLVDGQGADATLQNFPPALRGDVAANPDAGEHLAADARKGKDGFHNAFLKLVAGMIGVTPGQLIDRDKKRHQRRQLALATLLLFVVSLIGMFLFRFELDRAWAQQTMTHRKSASELAGLADRQVFTECDGALQCPQMVMLKGGDFQMGSPPDEVGRYNDEGPVRKIHVPRFAAGKFDITFAQWSSCVAYTKQADLERARAQKEPMTGCAPTTDSGFGWDKRPAINVSWDEAQGYVRWLNFMITGDAGQGPYRLLSEAEWEFAARAGSQTAYHWGNDAARVCMFANVMSRRTKLLYEALKGEISEAEACEDGYIETAPVGSFKPNAFGLFDMGGNVWQWVQDCYRPSYRADQTGAEAVEKSPANTCEKRVLRGASWRQIPRNIRSARRGSYKPDMKYNDVGFRVARIVQDGP